LAESISLGRQDVDHMKIVNSGPNSLTSFGKETPPQFSLEVVKAALQTGRDLGLKTVVHLSGNLSVKLAVEARRHSIEHGFSWARKT